MVLILLLSMAALTALLVCVIAPLYSKINEVQESNRELIASIEENTEDIEKYMTRVSVSLLRIHSQVLLVYKSTLESLTNEYLQKEDYERCKEIAEVIDSIEKIQSQIEIKLTIG